MSIDIHMTIFHLFVALMFLVVAFQISRLSKRVTNLQQWVEMLLGIKFDVLAEALERLKRYTDGEDIDPNTIYVRQEDWTKEKIGTTMEDMKSKYTKKVTEIENDNNNTV